VCEVRLVIFAILRVIGGPGVRVGMGTEGFVAVILRTLCIESVLREGHGESFLLDRTRYHQFWKALVAIQYAYLSISYSSYGLLLWQATSISVTSAYMST
jgi:hypothetical protein